MTDTFDLLSFARYSSLALFYLTVSSLLNYMCINFILTWFIWMPLSFNTTGVCIRVF